MTDFQKPRPLPRMEGVILDVDGTLLDSNDAHAWSWLKALKEAGFSSTFSEVRALIGMGSDKLLPRLMGVKKETELGRRLSSRKKEVFKREFLPKLRPFPSAHELLIRMQEEGLRLAVASSAESDELQKLLEIVDPQKGIRFLLPDRSSQSKAKPPGSKPDPDLLQLALGCLALPPEQVLMLGDTPYDLEAAEQAGVGLVALLCGGWSREFLAGAREIYQDPEHLLSHYESSAFFQGRGRRTKVA